MANWWKRLSAGLVFLALSVAPSLAQSPVVTQPSSQAATNFSSTIAVTNTFQSVFAASAKRQGCSIQNNGSNTMWVFFGAIADATKAKSFLLGVGQGISCGSIGVVAKDQVSITGTATEAFAATQDGAPLVGPSSTVTASVTPSGTQNVNLTQVAGASVATGHGTASGAIRVELPTDGTGVIAGVTTVTTLTGTTTLTPGGGAANLGKAEDAIAGSGDTGVAVYGVQQNTPADTATNGDYVGPQFSGGGMWTQDVPTATAAAGVAPSASSVAASNVVLKASAGNLYGFSCKAGASAGVCYVFNATALPSDGTVTPVDCYVISANTGVGVQYNPPMALGTGITVGFGTGTSCFTLAASATAFISGQAK
jgi:hypothetical protein